MPNLPWGSKRERRSVLEAAGLWDEFTALREEMKGEVKEFDELAEKRILEKMDPTLLESQSVQEEVQPTKKKRTKKVSKKQVEEEAAEVPLRGEVTREDLMWAFAHCDDEEISPTDAPSVNSWAFLKTFRSDPASRRGFADKLAKQAIGDDDDTGHDPALDRSELAATLRKRFSELRGAVRGQLARELPNVFGCAKAS